MKLTAMMVPVPGLPMGKMAKQLSNQMLIPRRRLTRNGGGPTFRGNGKKSIGGYAMTLAMTVFGNSSTANFKNLPSKPEVLILFGARIA
jgi:hypothetical protein